MPMYEYRCKNKECEIDVFEQYKPMEKRKDGKCPGCGRKGSLMISQCGYIIDFKEGFDPGLGQYVSTKRERESVLERNGLRRIKD